MKSYIKPSIKYIELRIEEGLAGIGSGSSVIGIIGKEYLMDEQTFSDNGLFFWLKILRK